MRINKSLNDDEAIAKLTDVELGVGEAALANGPINLNLAYLHAHPNIVTIASLPELGRRLSTLSEDVRTLVLRRLGGHLHASMQGDAG